VTRGPMDPPVPIQPYQPGPSAMQLFTEQLRAKAANGTNNDVFEKEAAKQWAELTYEEKKVYMDQATAEAAAAKEKKKKKKPTTNIPLPALKRFASTVAPGLKAETPHLGELQHVSTPTRATSANTFAEGRPEQDYPEEVDGTDGG